ncbi:twin-arginine translocase TatA/TatE family subunit [Desulfallas thermosapovorans]|uniref:Sec-independent protein translocase protein TatA n=1 Tax=Desulfallas thermosapovorans DSM 6562 TaxID=1121431 RepID=A0A5S4ZRK6_9FIRM|nr:twin-arginine translocase TatA/TatE family subunit [Desulfallas thermosapovorans]TYO95369.1 sec-independent protein translocase protein TatA [Desulfallas thermosapovorans DSM 6562]
MFNGLFQPTHLILILVVVLIIFGPGKLPDAAKAMGNALREMRNSFASNEDEAGKKEKMEGVAAATATTSSTPKVSTTKATD